MRHTREKRNLTLGDFMVKRTGYGLKKRRNRIKWKKRDALRRRGPRLKRRTNQERKKARKLRTLKQLIVARELEAIDRQQEREDKSVKAGAKGTSVMRDVGNMIVESPRPVLPVPDEDEFRSRILANVMATLFPPRLQAVGETPQSDVGARGEQHSNEYNALDELDKRSLRRIVYHAIFWKARREAFAYAPTYWFVPDEGAAECFVTPRVITILLEGIITVKEPLEQHLRVMVLLAAHTKLPWLEHTLLRSLYEWSSAYSQQQQNHGSRSSCGATCEDASGQVQGLVLLWSALVDRLVANKRTQTSDEGPRKEASGQKGRSKEDQGPLPPPFTDPAALLVRALIVFIRSARMLPLHEPALTQGARLLAKSRPALGHELLSAVLRRWPQRDSTKELSCVRLLGALLSALSPEAAFGMNPHSSNPTTVQMQLLKRLPQLLQSPQAQVAHEAMEMIGSNMYIFLRYIVANEDLLSRVTKALYAARSHWKPQVREGAEKLFDRALDYA